MSSQRRPTLPFSLSHANIDRHDEAHNLLHHTMMGDGKLAAGPHAAAARATPWATLGHSNCGAMRRSTSESIVPSEPLSGARIQQRRYIRHRSLVRRFTCACRVPCAFLTSTRSLTDQILFRMRTFLATRLCTRGQRSENAQQLWQHGDEILAQLHRDQRREGRSKRIVYRRHGPRVSYFIQGLRLAPCEEKFEGGCLQQRPRDCHAG